MNTGYFASPMHANLPAPVDVVSYTRHMDGLGLTNAGSASPPASRLGDDATGAVRMGWFTRFSVLTGLNFILLWLFVREFGIALIIAGVLGAVESAIT